MSLKVIDTSTGREVPVLGNLPVSKDGHVVGLNAEVRITVGERRFMVRTPPTLTGYSPGIDGAPLYEFHPESEEVARA